MNKLLTVVLIIFALTTSTFAGSNAKLAFVSTPNGPEMRVVPSKDGGPTQLSKQTATVQMQEWSQKNNTSNAKKKEEPKDNTFAKKDESKGTFNNPTWKRGKK